MNGGAALRRYEAVDWLESIVGPIGIPSKPSERDFISCLRNGIILCNVINIIQPSTIPKVVENHVPSEESESSVRDSRPLPAYQYFENVRNFLVAVEDLKLPSFEASDLQRENFEAGSAARIADCILALKSYYEWKTRNGGNGVFKPTTVKPPLSLHSFAAENRESLTGLIVKALSENMVDAKENLNDNILTLLEKVNQDPVKNLSEILIRCLEDKLPLLNLQETAGKADAVHPQHAPVLQENLAFHSDSKFDSVQPINDSRDHWRILQSQEKDLKDIKALWSETKREFGDFQKQLMTDLNHLGGLVKEMSSRARGYQKVIQENRKLYNIVQDLKGNIRIYCRIRPMLNAEANNVITVQGEDGTLVISDPSKPRGEGRKDYQFSRVYDPTATQDDLFKDVQPLIRSVMDGYSACILAYGQPLSGKSYTMYGETGAEKQTGINFLVLNDIFQTVNTRKHLITYEIRLQMVEIHNEQVHDLLAEVSAQQDKSIRPNITSHVVESSAEAINLVQFGQRLRLPGDTSSHSVVTVHVQGKGISGKILHSLLHLVDLAGNGEDDNSLSCLEDIITSLSQKNPNTHYQDSKLTSLLQDALGGKAKILVFAHVIPEEDSFTKTISTLKFTQRISTNDVEVAQSKKTCREVMELKNEIENLKIALNNKKSRRLSLESQGNAPPQTSRVRRLSLESQGKVPPQTSRIRRLSLESQGNVAPQTSRVRRLSLESQGKAPPQTSRVRRLSLESQGKAPPQTSRVRRLSLESQGKAPPQTSRVRKLSLENQGKVEETTQTSRVRRLSLENQGKVKATTQTSRVRRLSLENQGKVKVTTETSRVRRLSLETPTVPPCHEKEPTFIDCAPKHEEKDEGDILKESQTSAIAKTGNGKGSQIKKSLRTMGKLFNGSEKRNRDKLESSSTKSKDSSNGSETKIMRRHSLTNLPPPNTTRRTSLGRTSTDSAKAKTLDLTINGFLK